jgi:glucan biosynthesis protein C
MAVPLGRSVLGFPTLAYLPQYLGLFVVGTLAYRRGWLSTLPGSAGVAGLAAAVLGGVLLFPLAFSGRLFSLQLTPALTQAFGDGQWRSAVYALWDSLFAVGVCLALITVFRRSFNQGGRFGRFLSRHSYAVYIIHVPTIVFLAIAMRAVHLPSLLKFALAAGIMVPACFAVAYLVRKIPGVSRIL